MLQERTIEHFGKVRSYNFFNTIYNRYYCRFVRRDHNTRYVSKRVTIIAKSLDHAIIKCKEYYGRNIKKCFE